MILFLEDWKKYPRAIVDDRTSNKTFLELADKYNQMGLKNYFFHLALMQPELQGIDPYDPDLPVEIMAKINLEARYNPWYFYREIFRLPSQGGDVPDPLRANRGNIGAYWCYYNHVDIGLTQPRQTGKSVGADGINTHVSQVAGRNATFTLFTKDHELRSKNIQRLKDMRDLLPFYMNPYQKNIDTNNPYGISVDLHNNKVLTGVAQNSESAALNAGRGMTSESNQVDEGPFCKYINITIPAFLSSGNAARENAARHGSFFGNIFTTTAGKLDTVEGKYMYDLFKGGMSFDELKLFDLKDNSQLKRVVETQSDKKPLVYISLSHRQLGYSDEWLYTKMLESNSIGDEADRDYMNRWTTGSLRSPLSQKLLETIKDNKRSPDHIQITDRMYLINWYIPENQIEQRLASGKFVLGNDMSEAVGKDAVTLYLTDSQTLETIFTVRISESNIYTFIDWFVEKIMVKYENIVCIPERKMVGVVLIDTLIVKLIALNINPFKRIYNTIVEDGLHNTDEEYRFIHREPMTWPSYVADKYKQKFGYGTAGSGRHKRDNLYVETLSRAADLCATKLADDDLCTEIAHLVVKNGRIDHAAAGHDDMVIAWLLAMWFLLHSKNLDYYGIYNPASRARGLTEKEAEDALPVGWARIEHDKNKEVVDRIKVLLEKLDNEESQFRAEAYEAQIRSLSRRVVSDQLESRTINDFILNARESRERKLAERRQNAY